MKHIFIVNSISGKGKANSLLPIIEKVAIECQINYEIVKTEYAGHALKLAQEFSSMGDCALYSVGGDGTLFEILNGLRRNTPLGIIPAGSGNDFYRLIGPNPEKLEQIIKDTVMAPIRLIDIGVCNNKRFINVTSFGIDAEVNATASSLIRKTIITKGPAYVLGIIKNVIFLKSRKLKIITDQKTLEGDFYIVSCMNGRYYGNGIQAAPQSDLQDGVFDLCILHKIPVYKAYAFLSKYLKGQHIGFEGFELIHTKKAIVVSDDMIAGQSDGENYFIKEADIEIKEKWLSLKAPQYMDIIH